MALFSVFNVARESGEHNAFVCVCGGLLCGGPFARSAALGKRY